jgi:prolyl-tRNA synthetase
VGISIRGDLEVNIHKVMQYFGTEDIRPATSEELNTARLAEGFISPIHNEKIKIYADLSVTDMKNFCTGANRTNHDYWNCNADRDCQFEDIADFVLVKEGFTSLATGNLLRAEKCIEAGNIFDLGTKYSEAFDVKFMNRKGNHEHPVMGCYGLGVTRLMGTIVEAHHDKGGIIWPKPVAPYHVIIIPLGKPGTSEYKQSLSEAEKLEISLEHQNVEVLVDDREESPGIRFADADLIGIPLRIVISPRTLANKTVEWKERTDRETKEIPLDGMEKEILQWMRH